MQNRLYNLVAINEKTGRVAVLTKWPMPHEEACVMMGKFANYPGRRIQLQEARDDNRDQAQML